MPSNAVADDERWMRLALDLARRGEGLTRPNPPVGAVVVRGRRMVGWGYHRYAGGPHAEIYALRRAGTRARGATLYVTLEPCSTWGRTPPCTQAIIAAGIARVVAAVADPNPRHCGRGLRVLRRAGIEVDCGVGAREARELIAPFAKWIRTGRPYVTLKLAMSLDGKIADYQGRSRWLTGPAARRRVQALRRRCDAIMVGAGTVLADDPSLLPRPARGRRPQRVIVDGRGRVPLKARVLNDGHASQTIVVVGKDCAARKLAARSARGARVLALPARGGRIAPALLLRALGRLGLLHVLCEGGAELAAELIRARQVDEYVLWLAPRILAGNKAHGAVGGAGWPLARAPWLRFLEVTRVGRDLMLRARPAK